jgi:hypothetical protein
VQLVVVVVAESESDAAMVFTPGIMKVE